MSDPGISRLQRGFPIHEPDWTHAERDDLRRRWAKGESAYSIGDAIGRRPSEVLDEIRRCLTLARTTGPVEIPSHGNARGGEA